MDKEFISLSSIGPRRSAAILVVAALSGVHGCSKTSTSYDRLCRIYEDFESKPNTSEIAVEISTVVEKQLPEVYADYHVVMSSGSGERYEMLRMLARERLHQSDWVCDAIRKRYPPDSPQ